MKNEQDIYQQWFKTRTGSALVRMELFITVSTRIRGHFETWKSYWNAQRPNLQIESIEFCNDGNSTIIICSYNVESNRELINQLCFDLGVYVSSQILRDL